MGWPPSCDENGITLQRVFRWVCKHQDRVFLSVNTVLRNALAVAVYDVTYNDLWSYGYIDRRRSYKQLGLPSRYW